VTDGQGLPLAIVGAGGHRHDRQLLAETLEAVVGVRLEPTDEAPPPLCADKGEEEEECRQTAARYDDIPPIRSRGEAQQEKHAIPGDRARRWVVEVCHAWLNRFRKLLVRFEKKLATPLALRQCACASIVLKRAEVLR
jgi:transposase